MNYQNKENLDYRHTKYYSSNWLILDVTIEFKILGVDLIQHFKVFLQNDSKKIYKLHNLIFQPQIHLVQWRYIFCALDANKQYVTMHKQEVVKYNLLVLSDLIAQ